jgi:hypothetical protein
MIVPAAFTSVSTTSTLAVQYDIVLYYYLHRDSLPVSITSYNLNTAHWQYLD